MLRAQRTWQMSLNSNLKTCNLSFAWVLNLATSRPNCCESWYYHQWRIYQHHEALKFKRKPAAIGLLLCMHWSDNKKIKITFKNISFFFGSGEGNIVPSCLNYGEDPNVCIKGECELGCKILCPIEEKFLSHWGWQTNNSFKSHFFLCFSY